MKAAFLNIIRSLILLFVAAFYSAACAAEESSITFDYCQLGYNGNIVCEDIKDTRFVFSSLVVADANAKAYICLGEEVLAESSSVKSYFYWDNSGTRVEVSFASPIRLAKGNIYKIVLAAGAVHSYNNPAEVSGEISQEFEVPEYLTGIDSQLFDGCSLSRLQIGGFNFGAAEVEKTGNPKIKLYKGNELLDEAEISVGWDDYPLTNHSYVNFIFDKRIDLEEGSTYYLVLPEGSVRSKVRNDIVSKEIRVKINGVARQRLDFGEENKSAIVPEYCSLSSYSFPVCDDIDEPYFYFDCHVDVKEEAKAYIVSGDDVLAVSSKIVPNTYKEKTEVVVVFDAPVRLPKGFSYKLVIPAGTIRLHDNPDVLAGKIVGDFFVPGDFEGVLTAPSGIYDGCVVNSIFSGTIDFGLIETVSVDGAKLCLYKGDEEIASCDADAQYDDALGYMYFNFGKTIELEEDAQYQLVLPAGSVRTRWREDIVNKEMRINIYGPKFNTAVSDVVSDKVSLSCRDGVLHLNGVPHGAQVEVLTVGGNMVYSGKSYSESMQIPLPLNGCYLVRVGGKAYKVVA